MSKKTKKKSKKSAKQSKPTKLTLPPNPALPLNYFLGKPSITGERERLFDSKLDAVNYVEQECKGKAFTEGKVLEFGKNGKVKSIMHLQVRMERSFTWSNNGDE